MGGGAADPVASGVARWRLEGEGPAARLGGGG